MNSEPVSNSPTNKKRFERAIVMGASIAGLWTARALIDHFEEVWVIERDHLPEGPEFRSGAPQVRQFHTLLQSGLLQMREWFPGLEEELIAAGAVPYDVVGDVHLRIRQHWYPRFTSGWVLLSCSRLLLESGIRRRLRLDPCIRFVEGVEVVGLQTDEAKRARDRRADPEPPRRVSRPGRRGSGVRGRPGGGRVGAPLPYSRMAGANGVPCAKGKRGG